MAPRIDGIVNDTRTLRDATHDINVTLKTMPTREELKDDMVECCELTFPSIC